MPEAARGSAYKQTENEEKASGTIDLEQITGATAALSAYRREQGSPVDKALAAGAAAITMSARDMISAGIPVPSELMLAQVAGVWSSAELVEVIDPALVRVTDGCDGVHFVVPSANLYARDAALLGQAGGEERGHCRGGE